MKIAKGADVVPLADMRTHDVPGGYDDDRRTGGWLALERPGTQIYAGCWCLPRLDPLIGPDGTLSVIYIHHAMDRREENE